MSFQVLPSVLSLSVCGEDQIFLVSKNFSNNLKAGMMLTSVLSAPGKLRQEDCHKWEGQPGLQRETLSQNENPPACVPSHTSVILGEACLDQESKGK